MKSKDVLRLKYVRMPMSDEKLQLKIHPFDILPIFSVLRPLRLFVVNL
jgi:hypothetical protein